MRALRAFNAVLQRLSLQELHHNEGLLLELVDVVDYAKLGWFSQEAA